MKEYIARVFFTGVVLSTGIFFQSCKKYLDAKPNLHYTVPTTVQDLQSILDHNSLVNQRDASIAEASADNYYFLDGTYASLTPSNLKRIYTWEKDYLFEPGAGNDWSNSYDKVYKANVVLDNIDKIDQSQADINTLNNVKGQALFLRAKSFQQLAYMFAPAYDQGSAATDLGIPLRLDADFNIKSKRSSVLQTYTQIISDLKEAIRLLPVLPVHVIRASRPAACALLARTYLAMAEYDSSLKYADECLRMKSDLLNFNGDPEITSGTFAFIRYNKEVLYDANAQNNTLFLLGNTRAIIDSNLYRSYQAKDLRKTVYFMANTGASAGTYRWRGSYANGSTIFTGIATNEVYLTRAECYARKNNIPAAMNDLNTLMAKRWANGFFTPFTAVSAADALDKVLIERRKELLMTTIRWMDIKRLNKEGANITLKRVISGKTFILYPNSNRYALTIPEDVIAISGMQQNNRD